jgi:uncharacterized protein YdaU (DUF1376 family)
MHHYPFHVGDYLLKTVHLDPMEDLCYRRLLDIYYSSECPIPLETESVARRLRLSTEVVLKVLREFFREEKDGWHKGRCDREIVDYKARANRARENGKGGGRPKNQGKKPTRFSLGSDKEPGGNLDETGSKANQNQEPEPRTNKGTCTVDAAKTFAVELGLPASDGEACYEKWQGNGWKNGPNKIKDWKATIRSWKAAGYLPSQKQQGGGFQSSPQPKFKLVC